MGPLGLTMKCFCVADGLCVGTEEAYPAPPVQENPSCLTFTKKVLTGRSVAVT